MRAMRILPLMLVAVLLFGQLAIAGSAPKVKTVAPGQTYCPARTIVNNKVAVKAQGACYTLFIMRDAKRAYLLFGPKDARLAPGQVVRLSTPAGANLVKRMKYRIAIRAPEDVVPAGSIRMVGAKVEDYGTRVVLTILGTPSQNLMVMFSVQLKASGK